MCCSSLGYQLIQPIRDLQSSKVGYEYAHDRAQNGLGFLSLAIMAVTLVTRAMQLQMLAVSSMMARLRSLEAG